MTDGFLAVLSNIAKAALPYNCVFSLASPQNEELGYTFIEKRKGLDKLVAHIILNPAHTLLKKLSEIERYMFAFGVAIHEMLHQRFTDFDYFEEKYKEVKDSEKNLFSIIDNIFEDSRIELLVKLCFGGWALKCLDYTVITTWELSENISSLKEYQQIIAALIQFGDTGRIKGTFSTSKAADTFCFIAENFFIPAVRKPDGAGSTDLALEATRYLLSVYPEAKCIRAKPRHQTIGHGESVLIKPDKESASLLKEDLLNNTLQKVASGDYTKGSETNSPDTGEKEEEENKQEILRAAEILQSKINQAEKLHSSEIIRGSETVERLSLTDDPETTDINIIHVGTDKKDIDNYNRFSSRNNCSDYGAELASDLTVILNSKNEGWERSSRGRLNFERCFNTNMTSPFVFDKKLPEANDVAIALLIDCSGSMESGGRIETVKEFSACCAEAFNLLNIPFAIYGYSSTESCIDFRVYKDFEDKHWYNITSMCADGYNVDGASIRTAAGFLKRREEENKVLVILSDGATHNVLNAGLAIREAKQFSTVCGVALAPGEFDEIRQMYGENYIICEKANDLSDKLIEKFKELATKW